MSTRLAIPKMFVFPFPDLVYWHSYVMYISEIGHSYVLLFTSVLEFSYIFQRQCFLLIYRPFIACPWCKNVGISLVWSVCFWTETCRPYTQEFVFQCCLLWYCVIITYSTSSFYDYIMSYATVCIPLIISETPETYTLKCILCVIVRHRSSHD